MNKIRRQEIHTVIRELNNTIQLLQNGNLDNCHTLINKLISNIESILSDEEDYLDNIPENLQNGYRYQMSEESCDNLESAIDVLHDIEEDSKSEFVINTIQESINYLNDAV